MPNVTGLAVTTGFNAAENEILHVSNIIWKVNYHRKMSDTENNIIDYFWLY